VFWSCQGQIKVVSGQVKVKLKSGQGQVKIRSGQGQVCLGQDRSGEVRTKHVMYGQVHIS